MPSQNNNNSGSSPQQNFVDNKHNGYFTQAQNSTLPPNTQQVQTTPQSGQNPFNYGSIQNKGQTVFAPTKPGQVINNPHINTNPIPNTPLPIPTVQNNVQATQPIPLNQPLRPPLQQPVPIAQPIPPSQSPIQQIQTPPAVQNQNVNPTKPQYINPSNFKPLEKPQNLEDLKKQALEANKALPGDFNIYQDEYKKLEPVNTKIEINTHELLKLCIYVIPVFPIFVLLLKFSNDEEVLWHTRQSALTQTLWFVVLYALNSTGAPLVAGGGLTIATLWNLICIGFLIYAGSMAYMGKKYRIPIISEIGTNFIDKKS